MKQRFCVWLQRLADQKPRYSSSMYSGPGGIGVGVGRVKLPPRLSQRLASWLLKKK